MTLALAHQSHQEGYVVAEAAVDRITMWLLLTHEPVDLQVPAL